MPQAAVAAHRHVPSALGPALYGPDLGEPRPSRPTPCFGSTMPAIKNPSIVLTDVHFRWPDGSPALSGISGSFGPGKTGLVGTNGSGKSTLLRLVAGTLTPTAGSITTGADVGYLPQTLTLHHDATLMELLGIKDKVRALRAIESGDAAVEHFDALGDDWDIEARADEALEGIGLAGVGLDRRVGELSGGEAMLAAISGLRIRRTPITLLDEPTNNLDRRARSALGRILADWPGSLVVVSHDLALLELMDSTAELYEGGLTVFGGPYSEWQAYLDSQQAAAAQATRAAEQLVKTALRSAGLS